MNLRASLAVLSLLVFGASFASAASREERARELLDSARKRIAAGSSEQRQFALRELEEAAHLDPANDDIAIALGRLYLDSEMLQRAFDVSDRLAAHDSADARVLQLHGLAWRRRWLATSEEVARDRAILDLARAGRLAQDDYTCWASLMPLLVDAGEMDMVEMVAHLAARASPANPEGTLLVACAAQMRGELETADLLYRKAIPAVRARLRACFQDLSPILLPSQLKAYQDLDPRRRAAYEERFWRQNDPDPISAENEAQLEFWSRVTLATLLYGETRDGLWDLRAEYYIRYGRPAVAELNPPGQIARGGDWLSWAYPELGMRVWMGSPSAFTGFRNAFTASRTSIRPAPESLDTHGELQATPGAWAVFPKLPAGVDRMEARFAAAHFESDRGPRLLAKSEVRGEPDQRFEAQWVVLDSALSAVHRDSAAFTVSACDPTEAQSAGLALPLAPGRYRLGLRVTDEDGRRAVIRRDVLMPRPASGLALSDLVLTCGGASTNVVPEQGVRLELDTGLSPEHGDRLDAYFEIYRLDAGEGGARRFEYECTVRPRQLERRGWLSRMLSSREAPVALSMSRSEVTHGAIRRQFVSVPLKEVPAGSYQLEVRVRDTVSGEEALCSTPFVRGVPPGP